MSEIIKLALVDDDAFFVEVMKGHIKRYKDMEILIYASNGRQFIDTVETNKLKLDVVLLDLDMPDIDGMETMQYLTINHPNTKILIHTVHDDDAIFSYLIKNGAHGFLSKESDIDKVIDAIRIVYKYKYFADWDLKKTVASKKTNAKKTDNNKVHFSSRQIEIISLLFAGYTNKEISTKLFLSTRTVEDHRKNVLEKTNSRNIAQFALYVIQHNLIDLNDEKK